MHIFAPSWKHVSIVLVGYMKEHEILFLHHSKASKAHARSQRKDNTNHELKKKTIFKTIVGYIWYNIFIESFFGGVVVGFPLGGDVLNLKAQALERFVDLFGKTGAADGLACDAWGQLNRLQLTAIRPLGVHCNAASPMWLIYDRNIVWNPMAIHRTCHVLSLVLYVDSVVQKGDQNCFFPEHGAGFVVFPALKKPLSWTTSIGPVNVKNHP